MDVGNSRFTACQLGISSRKSFIRPLCLLCIHVLHQVREAVAARDDAEQRVDDIHRRLDQLTVEFDALRAEHCACEQRRSSVTPQNELNHETASTHDSLASGLSLIFVLNRSVVDV